MNVLFVGHSRKAWQINRTDNYSNPDRLTICTVAKQHDRRRTQSGIRRRAASHGTIFNGTSRGVPIFDLQELAGKAAAIGVHAEQGTILTEMVIENLLLERSSEKR